MASTANRNLTLVENEAEDTVTIRVTYTAQFSPLERHLVDHGLRFRETISVIGEDEGTANDVVLHTFPAQLFANGDILDNGSVQRNRSMTVSRASLNEDPDVALFGGDEIRCRITITPLGMPTTLSAFTNQEVLDGPVIVSPS